LVVPRVREGGIDFELLERYRRRQRQVDVMLLEAWESLFPLFGKEGIGEIRMDASHSYVHMDY
jgi:hypothetical protein